MKKIILVFITFFAIKLATSFGKRNQIQCPDGRKNCTPFITRTNWSTEVKLSRGGIYDFICKIDGNPTPKFTWTRNGADLKISNKSWTIQSLQYDDEGDYSCYACNSLGCTNHTLKLTLEGEKLEFIASLKNDSVQIGKPYTLWCKSNKPENQVKVRWFPHTKEEIILENLKITPDNWLKQMLENNTSTYKISSVSKEDEGWYACDVSAGSDKIWSHGYLTVEPADEDLSGMFLMSASLLTAMMIVCGFLLYYQKYRKSKLNMLEMSMHNYIRKVVIREEPNSEEKFEICIEKQIISYQNDNNESGNIYEMANYEIPSDEIWDIPRERVQLADKLGEGAFGTVYRAKVELKPNTFTMVAVKMLKDNHSDDDGLVDLLSEMQMMKMIGKHKNIISLQGRCVDGPLWVLMEFAAKGNLQNFLRNCRYSEISHSDGYTHMVNTLDEPALLGFAHQIAEAMNFLASKKVIHRDLAARNVLVTEEHVMKVADFGLTRYTRDKNYYHKEDAFGRVPFKWMAPESLYHQRYTTQSDVWSFGILLWEIISMGAAPYGTMSNLEVHDQIKKGLRMNKPETCSIETYKLMLHCWSYDAKERPNFSKILDELDTIIADFSEVRSTSTASLNNSIRYDSSSDSEDEMIVESSLYDVPLIADADASVIVVS